MTQEKIREARESILKEIRLMEHDLKGLKLKLEYWQLQCSHPRMKKYSDYDGVSGLYCPDCGYET